MNHTKQFIVNANAASIPLPDKFIHTFCTSPPYLALRAYAGEQEVDWPEVVYYPMLGVEPVTIAPMRAALGLEPTIEAFVGHIILTFREVHRVLRDDGCGFVVFGDSYQDGQLCMIPHRIALALQADGWIIRNDLVFAKVAPMPESVSGTRWERCRVKVKSLTTRNQAYSQVKQTFRDHSGDLTLPHNKSTEWTSCPGCPRCADTGGYVLRRGSWRHTRAHETVLMLAKGMNYYADQERVREALAPGTWESNYGNDGKGYPTNLSMKPTDALREAWSGNPANNTRSMNPAGRNPRSVLTPRPSSYKGAHYAVFSPDLIAPLLRATAPTRVCPVCGAPWAPVVEREQITRYRPNPLTDTRFVHAGGLRGIPNDIEGIKSQVLDHRPTCDHDADPIPGWVLDPFAGTFTTGEVCAELGVNGIGLDISLDYLDEHAKPRIGLTPSGALETLPLFAELET